MRKVAVFLFLFLVIVISGILFWQWNAYSKNTENNYESNKNVSQRIVLEVKSNKIVVQQTLQGLTKEKEYKYKLPKNISNLTCLNSDDEACLHDSKKKLIIPKLDEVTFSYSLPLAKRNKSLLLNDWAVTINDINIKETKVEIAETVNRDGMWLAGGRFVGFKKLDLIDYYSFKSSSDQVPLYWEDSQLPNDSLLKGITIYSDDEQLVSELKEHKIDNVEPFPLSIIITDKYKEKSNRGLAILNKESTIADIEREIVTQYYYYLTKEKIGSWFADLLSAIVLNDDPKTDKANSLLKSLKKSLSEYEFEQLKQAISNRTITFNSKSFDKYLSELKGLKTDFFKLNRDNKKSYSLYFYDPKEVFVNEIGTDIKAIVENEKRLFPFIETMEEFGFEVNKLSDQILLNKQSTVIRFYLNKNIFIFNEEDYGLLENPLSQINDEIYIEEKWLSNILNITVTENETNLKLSDSSM